MSRHKAITVRLGRRKRPPGFGRRAGGREAAAAIKALSCELNAGPTRTTRVLASSGREAEDGHAIRRQPSEMYSSTAAASLCCFSSSLSSVRAFCALLLLYLVGFFGFFCLFVSTAVAISV